VSDDAPAVPQDDIIPAPEGANPGLAIKKGVINRFVDADIQGAINRAMARLPAGKTVGVFAVADLDSGGYKGAHFAAVWRGPMGVSAMGVLGHTPQKGFEGQVALAWFG